MPKRESFAAVNHRIQLGMVFAGVLFDKDGTFVDFDKTWGAATYEVMRILSRGDQAAFDRIATAMHYEVDARRFRDTSPLIAGAPDTYMHHWAEAFGRPSDASMLSDLNKHFADETLRALAPIGRPSDTMQLLRARGLTLGLATNDSEASARDQLAQLGLDALMDFVAGYDTGHGAKPDAGMILAFARHLGVPPSRIVMVGDSPHDMMAARSAGAAAVAVLTGPAARDVLEPLADHVVADIAALPALLDHLANAPAGAPA